LPKIIDRRKKGKYISEELTMDFGERSTDRNGEKKPGD
jgi:hypothetical protein